jgi:hypothetical protein
MMESSQIVGRAAIGRSQLQALSQAFWKWDVPMVPQLHASFGDLAQRIVHPIDARAGHDPQNDAHLRGDCQRPTTGLQSAIMILCLNLNSNRELNRY